MYTWRILVKEIKINAQDMSRIKKYVDRNSSNPVNHYIREDKAGYLENHE